MAEHTMSITKSVLAFAIFAVSAAVLGACTQGGGFLKPGVADFALNETERTEVLNRYGEPSRRSTLVVARAGDVQSELASAFGGTLMVGTYETFEYFYTDRTNTHLFGAVPLQKTLVFEFWNDKLVHYNFVSTFRDDSSNFKEALISQLERNRTTSTEVIQIFGPPTGRAGFPLVPTMGEEQFIYQFFREGRWRRESKRLDIIFSVNGTVRDFRFDTETQPAAPRSGSVVVPVYIPRGK